MRAAYIGGGPTNVPYVPNPTLSLPFSFVSSLLPLPSTPPSTTPTSIRIVLDISVRSLTAIPRFNDRAKRKRKTSIKDRQNLSLFFFSPLFPAVRKYVMDGIEIRNFWMPSISPLARRPCDWSRKRRDARGITIVASTSHGRISAANSIGFACVAREMEDTEMSRRKKDALQEEGRRTGRWRLTSPTVSVGVSLAVRLFYEAPLKNDSPCCCVG